MIYPDVFEQAACRDQDPLLWDTDTHHHGRLGRNDSCLMCDEAKDLCFTCPAKIDCIERGIALRTSGLIWGGVVWEKGRPKKFR